MKSSSVKVSQGYESNIVSGSRLSKIVLYCMCQCTGSWGADFSSASWGNYWSDSSGAKLKSLKLYTSASDTEGIELIRYSVNKPTMGLKIDNSLEVDGNGLLTTSFKPQGVTGLNAVTQSQYDALVQGGTLDSTGLYIITDTRRMYFGTTQISSGIYTTVTGQ